MKHVSTSHWLELVPYHAPGSRKPYDTHAHDLQVLRGEEDLRELLDDDDDEDEDFTLDWDELMGPDPFREGALQALLIKSRHCCLSSEVPRPPCAASAKCCGMDTPLPQGTDTCMQHALPVLSTISRWNADEGKPPPPPRRSERQRKYVYKNKNERPGHRERPVQATARLQSKWAPEHLVYIHYCVLSCAIAGAGCAACDQVHALKVQERFK